MRIENRKIGENPKPKILVIDDELDLQYVFKKILEKEGYEMIAASSGPEGIKKNESNDPDLIILDLKMPKMDGIETLGNIRKTDKNVTVIILTGYPDANTVRGAVDLDVYEYLAKPYKLNVIKRLIKEALASRKENGE